MPTLVIESSYTPGGCEVARQPHYQAFWALPEPCDLTKPTERAWFRAALSILQKSTNSDAVGDLARVMRVPGSLNYKRGEPNLIRPVEFHPEGVVL